VWVSIVRVCDMSVRKEPSDGLSARQKLTLFHGTGVTASEALSLDDENVTFDFMIRNGVKPVNITAAGVRVTTLKRHGVAEASQLRRLGFDALHLVDPEWCADASAAYGASNVISAFLVSPHDAVALSGSEAVKTLNITVDALLEACAGAPLEAVSVLKQVTDTHPLKGVRSIVLLDTGMRSQQLKQLGYGLLTLKELDGATTEQIRKLGFM
jgi:hypothetical protein